MTEKIKSIADVTKSLEELKINAKRALTDSEVMWNSAIDIAIKRIESFKADTNKDLVAFKKCEDGQECSGCRLREVCFDKDPDTVAPNLLRQIIGVG